MASDRASSAKCDDSACHLAKPRQCSFGHLCPRSRRRSSIYPLQRSFDWTRSEFGTNDGTGLSRLRDSSLSLSCPALNLLKDTSPWASPPSVVNQCSLRVNPQAIIRRRSGHAAGRRVSSNLPPINRSHSPGSGSVDRSRMSPVPVSSSPQPSQQQSKQMLGPLKLNLCNETRRWSLASLPSSGYDTPESSAFSSHYSSQEKLIAMVNDLKVADSACSNGSSSFCEEQPPVGPKSPSIRWRSRSFSNSFGVPLSDGEELVRSSSNMYKTRFPKAKEQMEIKLTRFVEEHSIDSAAALLGEGRSGCKLHEIVSNGSARFVLHQIVELAADCLGKSQEDLISAAYFYEMTENLQNILTEAKEKAACCYPLLREIATKLLIIISRPARLLECFEFDPKEFYQMMEEVEGYAKGQGETKQSLPQYVLQKLGLRPSDADAELPAEMDCMALLRISGVGSSFSTSHHEGLDDSALSQETDKTGCSSGSSSSRPPKRIVLKEENFDEIKLISNGAYGAVVLVRSKETRQRFALKKIRKSNLVLRNQLEQVFAERDIMTFSDNPFVVSFYGSFETKTHLCMLMEYVEGGDCATLLKNVTVLPMEVARLYIAETILAVEYLHSYGIVHRDLKPDNLLITAMGHVKLTDFGLSKIGLMNRTTILCEGYIDVAETKQFQDRQICGTPEYIAPEVILRQGYGKPVDWWAVGVILFEFLVGTVPFFGETPEELFAHVISGSSVVFPEEPFCPPDEAVDLIRSLLQVNPLDRLGTVGGAMELKVHPFFSSLNWDTLLRQKAEFIPQLRNEEDTSYFDTRSDRYCHEMDSGDEGWSENSSIFSSFSSCSPRYSLLADSLSTKDSISSSLVLSSEEADSSGSKFLTVQDKEYTEDSSKSAGNTPVQETVASVLPKLSVSFENHEVDDGSTPKELSPVEELLSSTGECSRLPETSNSSSGIVVPSSSVSVMKGRQQQQQQQQQQQECALHLIIPPDSSSSSSPVITSATVSCVSACTSSGGGGAVSSHQSPSASSGSSHDFSPRNLDASDSAQPSVNGYKPAVVIHRGAKGFGFCIKSVRVYMGSSDLYTIQHIVSAVDDESQAFEHGLRVDDLITHVNGASVQNVTQPELLQKLMCSGDWLTLRVTPLEHTSIKMCPARRHAGRQSRRACFKQKLQRRPLERRKRAPLFRRLSGKRVNNELGGGATSAALVQSLHRSVSSTEGLCADVATSSSSVPCVFSSSFHEGSPSWRSSLLPYSLDILSARNMSAPVTSSGRPSSLHGLKLTKSIKAANARRKEAQVMPLSPLARTDHHQQQSSTATKPQILLSPSSASPLAVGLMAAPKTSTVRSQSFRCARKTCSKQI